MKQITEDYVSYEIAKLLKEKGFVEQEIHYIYYYYEEDDGYCFEKLLNGDKFDSKKMIAVPTHQIALKWLREVYRIETHIVLSELNADNSRKYMFDIYSSDINRAFDSVQKEGFNSYEQAIEAALLYVLKNLI